MPRIGVHRLQHAHDLPLPERATSGAAGFDLSAALVAKTPLTIRSRSWRAVPTGLVLMLPEGFEAQVRPRSGLAAKFGVTVLNAPGTIDADYRGEVRVLLINHGVEDFVIEHGMRVAQLVVQSLQDVVFEDAELSLETERGAGGFGSTGIQGRAEDKP